uniref:Small integral membrane protein 38 n=1 Tax=Heterorhabditis bacteriophora TaxID=37862 RepID=A0A1I7X7V5_HETBA
MFRSELRRTYCPVVIIIVAAVVIFYLWCTIIISMTFMLIRDKKRYGYDPEEDFETRGMERISSSFI